MVSAAGRQRSGPFLLPVLILTARGDANAKKRLCPHKKNLDEHFPEVAGAASVRVSGP
jgi:hypothetical protein